MSSDTKRERIIASRMKLRDRFLGKIANTPSLADPSPQGRGPTNRHGMPQIPPDQVAVDKWPIEDLGERPAIEKADWRLEIAGLCEFPQTFTWEEFLAFDQIEDVSDFHCVTKWSRLDVKWRGVRVADVLAAVSPADQVGFLLCHAYDGYTTNVPIEEALKSDVLLVHTADGEPLSVEHGGPVRMITPQLYAWKGAKWISRIELLAEDRPGFWEQRGYSNTAYPWRNDRYS